MPAYGRISCSASCAADPHPARKRAPTSPFQGGWSKRDTPAKKPKRRASGSLFPPPEGVGESRLSKSYIACKRANRRFLRGLRSWGVFDGNTYRALWSSRSQGPELQARILRDTVHCHCGFAVRRQELLGYVAFRSGEGGDASASLEAAVRHSVARHLHGRVPKPRSARLCRGVCPFRARICGGDRPKPSDCNRWQGDARCVRDRSAVCPAHDGIGVVPGGAHDTGGAAGCWRKRGQGGARTARFARSEGCHCDRRCAALPEPAGRRGQTARRRLRAGAEGKSGWALCRRREAGSGDENAKEGNRRDRGRGAWPQGATVCARDRSAAARETARLSRSGRDRGGGACAHPQRQTRAETVALCPLALYGRQGCPRCGARPLGHREWTSLGARRDLSRGRLSYAQGSRSGKPCPDPPNLRQYSAPRQKKGHDTWKDDARRLERLVSVQADDSNAIALPCGGGLGWGVQASLRQSGIMLES